MKNHIRILAVGLLIVSSAFAEERGLSVIPGLNREQAQALNPPHQRRTLAVLSVDGGASQNIADRLMLLLQDDPNYFIITVEEGETLEDIARSYIVPVAELARVNGLKPGHRIRAGDKLKIPPSVY
jgi:hypothetical protein